MFAWMQWHDTYAVDAQSSLLSQLRPRCSGRFGTWCCPTTDLLHSPTEIS